MLKEIIASILIPALLLQIAGCVSSKEMTINELKNVNKNEVIKIVTSGSAEYLLQNPPESMSTYKWSLDDDNIYIYPSYAFMKRADSLKIPLNSIKSISAEKIDAAETTVLVVVILLSGAIALGISFGSAVAQLKGCNVQRNYK